MPAYIDTFNHYLSIGTILLQIAIVVIIVCLLFFRSRTNPILLFFKEYTFILAFLIAAGGVTLSLFYSEVIGFPPCELCWIQRIFIYPQAILLGMELYKRDRRVVDYSMVLAICGSLVSIFHIYIENGGSSALACAIGGKATISCATLYVYEFYYVTIPVMALTASLFILTLLINYKYVSNKK